MQNMEIEKEVQVSVIVPNYNYARYLPMRIESILNQTFTDFELFYSMMHQQTKAFLF